MGLVDRVSIWMLEQNFEIPSGKSCTSPGNRMGLGVQKPPKLKWNGAWFFVTLFHMFYRCETKYLKIFEVNELFTTRKHVFCLRQTLRLFSTSFLSYLLNLVNSVNSQVVSKFEFGQNILFVDHDIKSIFRRKTSGRERWESTEHLPCEKLSCYSFSFFIYPDPELKKPAITKSNYNRGS